jgi:hypothetical protein
VKLSYVKTVEELAEFDCENVETGVLLARVLAVPMLQFPDRRKHQYYIHNKATAEEGILTFIAVL